MQNEQTQVDCALLQRPASDEVEEWFFKYIKYKRPKETRITCQLLLHFPLSNMGGYNLARLYHLPLGCSEAEEDD